MHRFIPLLFLFAACAGDPLELNIIDVDLAIPDDGLTAITVNADELLPAHEDLTVKLSFRADAGAKGKLWVQGKYPIDLPSLEVNGEEPNISIVPSPGIWQDLEVVFKASTDDSPALLPAVYLNGSPVYYQKVLEANNEPVGPLRLETESGNIELTDVRTSSSAGRSSVMGEDGFPELNIPLLRYEYYELPRGTEEVRNWALLTPKKTGYINRFDLNQIREQGTNYAIRFFGELEIPKALEYNFRIWGPPAATLYIDGNELISKTGTPDGMEGEKSISLSEGKHPFRVDVVQSVNWNRFDVAYTVVGSDHEEIYLNTMQSGKVIAGPASPKPDVLEMDDEPFLLRSFLYFPAPKVYEEATKRTHVISVGEADGPHYSVDLQTGGILQIWRGPFADTHDMWAGRGEPQVMRPLGAALSFDGTPQFAASDTKNWPEAPVDPDEDDFAHVAYELDDAGRPTFIYNAGQGHSLSDKTIPDGHGLLREINHNAGGNSEYFTQLAAAREIKETAPGEFSLRGPGLKIKIESYDGSGLTLQRSNGIDRLIAQLPAKGHIRYRMDW